MLYICNVVYVFVLPHLVRGVSVWCIVILASAQSGVGSKKPLASASRKPPPPSRSAGLGRPATGKTATTTGKKSPSALSSPVEVDLVYITDTGRKQAVDADFFRLIRAKHYVLSSVEPATDTLDSLLAGKKAWNQPTAEVQLIPTHDSQNLHLWMRLKEGELERESITIAPSAARCQINMEQGDAGDTCAAYRLEL